MPWQQLFAKLQIFISNYLDICHRPALSIAMKRIYVIGASGSGKSTLSRNLSEKLNLPHYDLDEYFWQPGWKPTPTEEFLGKARALASADSWIIDGAQPAAKPIVLERADTCIWVDPAPARLLTQLFARTIGEWAHKKPVCNGNTASLAKNFTSANSIFVWAMKTYLENKKTLTPIFNQARKDDTPGPRLVHIRNRREAAAFVNALAAPSPKY